MQFKSILSLNILCIGILEYALRINEQDNGDEPFFCSTQDEPQTTFVQIHNTSCKLISWNTEQFSTMESTPQKRCREVTQRLNKLFVNYRELAIGKIDENSIIYSVPKRKKNRELINIPEYLLPFYLVHIHELIHKVSTSVCVNNSIIDTDILDVVTKVKNFKFKLYGKYLFKMLNRFILSIIKRKSGMNFVNHFLLESIPFDQLFLIGGGLLCKQQNKLNHRQKSFLLCTN
ncbi:MAG: COP23 domain-containing protein [Cyanobacteria bacterium P01_F01_bin.143]